MEMKMRSEIIGRGAAALDSDEKVETLSGAVERLDHHLSWLENHLSNMNDVVHGPCPSEKGASLQALPSGLMGRLDELGERAYRAAIIAQSISERL